MCYKVYYILRNKNECNICDFFLSKSVRHYLERIHFRPAEKLMLGFPNDFHCPLSPSPFFPHSVSNEIDVRMRGLFFFSGGMRYFVLLPVLIQDKLVLQRY